MKRLDWDSEFFGLEVGMAASAHESTAAFDCVWMLIDAADALAVQEAEAHGYRFRDIRVQYERALDWAPRVLRVCEPADTEPLVQIARQAHRITRFYADHNLDRDRCDDLYETWMRKAIAEDSVVVAGEVGSPSGYVTVRSGQIGLIAVADSHQRRGLGVALVTEAVSVCATQGSDRVTVVTQGRNLAANRLFQSCGFRVASTKVWMSKWSRRPAC